MTTIALDDELRDAIRYHPRYEALIAADPDYWIPRARQAARALNLPAAPGAAVVSLASPAKVTGDVSPPRSTDPAAPRAAEPVPVPARPHFPSLGQQAANFAGALARHAAGGLRDAPESVKAARLEICAKCDQLSNGRCRACGCWVSRKAAWPRESCPLGKWPSLEDGGECGCLSK